MIRWPTSANRNSESESQCQVAKNKSKSENTTEGGKHFPSSGSNAIVLSFWFSASKRIFSSHTVVIGCTSTVNFTTITVYKSITLQPHTFEQESYPESGRMSSISKQDQSF